MMSNRPDEVVKILNQEEKLWSLRFFKHLNEGWSGARLYLCHDLENRSLVVVKSFSREEDALKEYRNNEEAKIALPGLAAGCLSRVFSVGAGACFAMPFLGGKDGESFSKIVLNALNTGYCQQALQVISLLSPRLKGITPSTEWKEAFDDTFDTKTKSALQKLDPALQQEFLDWWGIKRSARKKRRIAFGIGHGDLHADNLFVEKSSQLLEGDLSLIDFGCFGVHPCLKDLARLERDIRFRLFDAAPESADPDSARYLRDQEAISLAVSGGPTIDGRPGTVATLVKAIRTQATNLLGGTAAFQFDYVRLREFLFYAVSPIQERRVSRPQRLAAFKEAMALARQIDRYYEEEDRANEGALLSLLAYAFLRLEQLPSGGWARSLPTWIQELHGDTEESRSRAYRLRKTGGINLTCIALLNYTRTLCRVRDIVPEREWKEKRDLGAFLEELKTIEKRNQVCSRVSSYINGRINQEGAIAASELVRYDDTALLHTIQGMIVLLLAYFSAGTMCDPSLFVNIRKMSNYLKSHGKETTPADDRRFEVYCALTFLSHLLEFEFFKTTNSDTAKVLNELRSTLVVIKDGISMEAANFFPDTISNASGFLLNLPLLWSLSGEELNEGNLNFTGTSLDRINLLEEGPVSCTMQGKQVGDWGHTAEYYWARCRMAPPSARENEETTAIRTLSELLTDQEALAHTHGVSFSSALGLCKPAKLETLRQLDSRISNILGARATERNLMALVSWIFSKVYPDFPVLKMNLEDDREILKNFPNGHELLAEASSIKNWLLRKLQPGCYVPAEEQSSNLWQREVKGSIAATKAFYDDAVLGEQNLVSNEKLLPGKRWFHLFNYLDGDPGDKAWVLNVGCGSSIHAFSDFMPKGFKVHFLDFSGRVVGRLRKKLRDDNVGKDRYVITTENIEELPTARLAKRPYQVIFADAILFHVGKKQLPAILGRFYEDLASNGFLFANFKINDHTMIGMDGRFFEYFADSKEIQKLVEDAGFYVEDQTITRKQASMYKSPYPTEWVHFICSKGRQD